MGKSNTPMRTFYINCENHTWLDRKIAVKIEGKTPIQALRNYYKRIGKDLNVTVADGDMNVSITDEVEVNGKSYNAGYNHHHYCVREKGLFQKLVELHYKK